MTLRAALPRHAVLTYTGRRLLAGLFLFVITPLGVASALQYLHAHRTIERQTRMLLNTVADSIESQVLVLLHSKKERAADFATDGFVVEALRVPGDHGAIEAHLCRKLAVDADLISVSLLDTLSRRVVACPMDTTPGQATRVPPLVWAAPIVQGIGTPRGLRVLSVFAPIRGADGAPLGILQADFDPSILAGALDGALATRLGAHTVMGGLGDRIDIYIVDGRQQVIAGRQGKLGTRAPTIAVKTTLSEHLEYAGEYTEPGGEVMLAATMYLAEPGWAVVATMAKREALAPLRDFGLAALAYMAGAMLVVLIAALLVTARIARPVLDMAAATERIAAGDWESRIDVGRLRGEGAVLGRSVNAMLDALHRSFSALRRAQVFNDDVIATIPSGLLVIDGGGRVTLANRRFGSLACVAPGDVLGVAAAEALEIAGVPAEAARALAEGEESRELDSEGPSQDHPGRAFHLARVTLSDGQRLVVVDDITERRRAERLKREFVSVVSHELRTPLTSILGALGLIEGGIAGEMSPRATKLVSIAKSNCERLVRLINDILDIEKIESDQMSLAPRPLDVAAFLAQSVEASREYGARLGCGVRMEGCVDGLKVMADPDRLMQVMANLLSNAFKFAPPGASVQVRVSHDAGRVRVEVANEGGPIPEEFRSRIFGKFQQADASDSRKKGGTGLGLAICKTIVEKHGGQIGFTSGPEVTTFFFEMPAWTDEPRAVAEAPSGKARILVCEDDPDVATLLSMMLEGAGYDIDVAHDAAGAKAHLAGRHYAAMTLDLVLPGQDGISFIRELRQARATRDLPIVVVSLKAGEGRAVTGSALAIVDWIDKPIDRGHLLSAVRRATHPRCEERPRILHVEDDADIRAIVRMLLGDEADVTFAADIEQAKRHLCGERFDLVLLDLLLPDGDGLDILPLLASSANGNVPVVVFSVKELDPETSRRVATALVKSRTTNLGLVEAVRAALMPYAEGASLVAPVMAGQERKGP